MSQGLEVITPTAMVTVGGKPTMAFLEFDPASGNVAFVSEDGLHPASVNTAATYGTVIVPVTVLANEVGPELAYSLGEEEAAFTSAYEVNFLQGTGNNLVEVFKALNQIKIDIGMIDAFGNRALLQFKFGALDGVDRCISQLAKTDPPVAPILIHVPQADPLANLARIRSRYRSQLI